MLLKVALNTIKPNQTNQLRLNFTGHYNFEPILIQISDFMFKEAFAFYISLDHIFMQEMHFNT
jgi:hypothetical protein